MLKSNLIVLHHQGFFLGQLNSLLSLFSKMHWVGLSKINLAYLPCPEDKGLVPGALGYGIICKFMQTLERKSWGTTHHEPQIGFWWEFNQVVSWQSPKKFLPRLEMKTMVYRQTLRLSWHVFLFADRGRSFIVGSAGRNANFTLHIRTTGKIGWFVYDYKLQFQLTRMS